MTARYGLANGGEPSPGLLFLRTAALAMKRTLITAAAAAGSPGAVLNFAGCTTSA